jgi:predicted nucleotidyltransferase
MSGHRGDVPDDERDSVVPLPLPEAMIGARLDADHEPKVGASMISCVVCGFAIDERVNGRRRHYPQSEELPQVAPWLQAYGTRIDS